jgi:D-tyrosyl-tRNA(Tyr) deacylase
MTFLPASARGWVVRPNRGASRDFGRRPCVLDVQGTGRKRPGPDLEATAWTPVPFCQRDGRHSLAVISRFRPARARRVALVRGLLQRVTAARVEVEGEVVGSIGPGLLVLVGVTHDDTEVDAARLASKLWGLRIFDDAEGVMNRSAADVGGEVLVVSQFTLYGDTRKGRRPSWIDAARPETAEPLVDVVVSELRALGASVATGRFGADMAVSLTNDGPVTLLVET